ncbi:MAG: CHAD domain-containing protein [Candidatus Accumulibacter sp.]|uniref:CYTH and CHAD domain-containing protein n=1 Tax=Accumulibacter sp. TaxID=2053492 RepID=UPI001A399CE1|nr:CHAD domain-containing protein [Accumulibacter sp.]MBL8391988.1 CHAD domain-containing protein [Accumulibacter sp.]HRD91026.1 CHAD domain-containing protein [Accumulibacter sp.]
MATETEIKLSLSATAARQLSELPLLAGSGRSSKLLVNTYYDTPDRRLRSEHMVVRYRRQGRQCLLGVKTAPPIAAGLAQRGEWEAPGQPGDFDFGHVDSIAVRALLESLREELQPVFTTRFRRDAYVVAPRPGVRIEVALDRGRIDAGGIRQSIREVELELLSGSLNDLFAVALDLQASLPMHPEASSKSERAYRLLDGAALIAVKAQPVAVHPEMQTMAAFRLIALACIGHLQSNEQGVCLSDGAEFVHQARVAIRRLRSAIRLWEPLLPEPFVARFDPLWQALATQLGDNRNWDVFRVETLPLLVEAFAGRVDGARLESRVYGRCASSHRVSRRALQSEDYSRLLLDFTAELVALPASPAGLLADFVPRCLSKRARRVNERAAAPLQADVAARHRLRVAFKQLRYGLEFFAPLLADPLRTEYLQSATALQEMLGRLNDLAVATQLVAAVLPAGNRAEVQAWLAAQAESLLPEFAQLLDDFQRRSAPWQSPEQWVGDRSRSRKLAHSL